MTLCAVRKDIFLFKNVFRFFHLSHILSVFVLSGSGKSLEFDDFVNCCIKIKLVNFPSRRRSKFNFTSKKLLQSFFLKILRTLFNQKKKPLS